MTVETASVRLFISTSEMLKTASLVLLGSLACAMGLELMFLVLPTSTYTDTGYHIDPYIITYRPNHEFTTSFGWNLEHPIRHRSNNLGFLSAHDFAPNPRAIAVIGDSFVDASMLPDPARVGDQIEHALPHRPIYAMGGPGSNLLDYAERIRYAADHLKVSDFVLIIERGDIKQVLCGSGNIHAICLDRSTWKVRIELVPAPSRIKMILRHSSLLQYLLGHLRFNLGELLKHASRPTSPPVSEADVKAPSVWSDLTESDIDKILTIFFERVAPFKKRRLIVVLDSDRDAINHGVIPTDSRREFFMRRCREFGAEIIDTEPLFQDFVMRTGRHLEVSPIDKHWNGAATGLVAEAVRRAFEARREPLPKTD